MKRKMWKKVSCLCLALSLSGVFGLCENVSAAMAGESQMDMSASSPDGSEEWEKLKIDMGGPETNNDTGFYGTPLANGLFGVKENGGVTEDVFVLNHSTFWSGDPKYRDYLWEGNEGYQNSQEERHAGYNEMIDTFKRAYTEGISKGERYDLMKSIPDTTQRMWEADLHSAFISAGRMKLGFPKLTDTTDYKRILDLDTATSEISFQKDKVGYKRESFISNPDNVMVTRITNDGNQLMDMNVTLELHGNMVGKSSYNKVEADRETKEIVMTQRAPYDFAAERWSEDRGILNESRAKVLLPEGGKVVVDGTSLKVSEASEIIVLYTSETSFKDAFTDPSNSGVDYSGKIRQTLDTASQKTYEELREQHLEEYRSLFRRFWIDMEGSDIKTVNGTNVSPYEYARYYQYGRYINIACERANSIMPQGLFGMWSPAWKGTNDGAYFLNENMQKMQALKGAGNLEDSSDGQYNFMKSWADERTGQRTAQVTYGAEEGAWMMSHSTGIWAKSGMWGGQVRYGSWLAGGIWALDSLYDKYDFTKDTELLKKYYPLLEGAAKFAISTLIEVDGVKGELKGYKVVAPAGSPEHWYWVGDKKVGFDISTTCDTLLYYNLFNMLEQGAVALKRAGISYDEEFLQRALDTRSQMVPLEMFIDEDTGRLKEWYNEYETGDLNHGHASHLLGLFLGHININEDDTPELWQAQKAELERWMNNDCYGYHPDGSLMAMRAGKEDYAFENMSHGVVGTGYNHDMVMEWTALANSIAESVVDSRFDQINLMENLPSAWSSGTVKGIRARGGYQLNLTWENGELLSCVIDSPTGETPRVMYKGEPVNLSTDSRFTVNRAEASPQDLIYEAQDKLDEKYTKESKNVLQAALENNNYEDIYAALLAMDPVRFIVRDVTIEAEEGMQVLTERGQTLQLTANSDKKDAKYKWTVEKAEGGSAEQIATIDKNGTITAISGGKVIVTASIEGESRSKASKEILIELGTMENVDDRDSRIKYSGNWVQWNEIEEGQHVNGTITHSTVKGDKAALDFYGDGIEFIGSKAGHISDFKVTIDGKVAADRVSSAGDGEYGIVMFAAMDLEKGNHSITVESLGNRIDVDAFNVYEQIPAETDRKDLIKEYRRASEITDQGNYPENAWTEFVEARENAILVINTFNANQEDIDKAGKALRNAIDKLMQTNPDPETGAELTSLKLAVTMADKMEAEQTENHCYTDESWAMVTEALNAARVLLEQNEISQAEADEAFYNLITVCNLLENGVQKVGLKAAIEGTKAILADESALASYEEESVKKVKKALEEAQNIFSLDGMSQETVNSATSNLLNAVTSLLVLENDTRLGILIQQADEMLKNSEQYTSSSLQNLKEKLDAARAVAGNSQATAQEMDKAYLDLAEAMTSLVRKANKEELKNALDQANKILHDSGRYLESSISGLKGAADSAQLIYDEEGADTTKVGEVLKKLIQEILKARLKGDVNQNGNVDSQDAALLLKGNAELEVLTEEQNQAADVNRDGVTDSSDAAVILQYSAERMDGFL